MLTLGESLFTGKWWAQGKKELPNDLQGSLRTAKGPCNSKPKSTDGSPIIRGVHTVFRWLVLVDIMFKKNARCCGRGQMRPLLLQGICFTVRETGPEQMSPGT